MQVADKSQSCVLDAHSSISVDKNKIGLGDIVNGGAFTLSLVRY